MGVRTPWHSSAWFWVPWFVATVVFISLFAFSFFGDSPPDGTETSSIRMERVVVDGRDATCFIYDTSLDCEWFDE